MNDHYLDWKRNQLRKTAKMARKQPKRSCLLLKSHHMRRFHIRNPWTRPLMVFNYAALLIQKVYRGHVSRQGYLRNETNNKHRSKKKVASNHQLDRYLAKLDYYKITGVRKPEWMGGGFSSWCAVQIQSIWRMNRCRRRAMRRKMMMYQIAALTIQNMWRYYWFTKIRPISKVTVTVGKGRDKSTPALIIQRKWRSFCARRIFKYFSDLIRFKLKGAPGDLLRTIVPGEADFLDKAAGVHVRFRLGGSVFPPSIYFKVYTHRPLCDVNAFAPRDYNGEKNEILKDQKYRFEKSPPRRKLGPNASQGKQNIRVGTKYFGTKVTTTVGIEQWYKRDENNPWRPIASQVVNDILVPPWLKDEVPMTKKIAPFHFSRLRRQADMDKSKLRKKRDWMMKAYTMAKEASDDVEGPTGSHHHGWDDDKHEQSQNHGSTNMREDKQQHPPPRSNSNLFDHPIENNPRVVRSNQSSEHKQSYHEHHHDHESYHKPMAYPGADYKQTDHHNNHTHSTRSFSLSEKDEDHEYHRNQQQGDPRYHDDWAPAEAKHATNHPPSSSYAPNTNKSTRHATFNVPETTKPEAKNKPKDVVSSFLYQPLNICIYNLLIKLNVAFSHHYYSVVISFLSLIFSNNFSHASMFF